MLDASITKTADSRTVRIRPNLEKWLAAYPVEKYPPCRATPTRIKALHKRAGVPWPHDCLRHSFATYAYEQAHDAAAVAAELGHAGTSVFFKHYRALASPGDGERFFSIVP